MGGPVPKIVTVEVPKVQIPSPVRTGDFLQGVEK